MLYFQILEIVVCIQVHCLFLTFFMSDDIMDLLNYTKSIKKLYNIVKRGG